MADLRTSESGLHRRSKISSEKKMANCRRDSNLARTGAQFHPNPFPAPHPALCVVRLSDRLFPVSPDLCRRYHQLRPPTSSGARLLVFRKLELPLDFEAYPTSVIVMSSLSLKQHNGELKGGAKASSAGRPWTLACIIRGFRN
ncbi:hypothetical protein J5N97_017579 [Dioscorea zingiberensis]|uniref:Uncharacterized protein n=1 Tax=Dioscorea zingiberensis TaxID=325984 RepID=A0A9D5CM99_9LILI|nr:hypothetical protein J5N97_017579 [Dioscorea zingiberensis]